MDLSILYIPFLIVYILNVVSTRADQDNTGCNFKHTGSHPAYKALNKMQDERYTIEVQNGEGDNYKYSVGICATSSAGDDGTAYEDTAVKQVKVDSNNKALETKDCGKFTEADFMQGTNWLQLSYMGGDAYHGHCGHESRTSQLMIVCDESLKGHKGKLSFSEEANAKNDSCYYLFELSHYAACNVKKSEYSLSVGSIICIVFFSLVVVYLVAGVIVMRIRGAQGWEQIPNYPFWKSFGNHAADGCDLVFRSSDSGSREYRGVTGETMEQEIPRSSEPDDHLLSM